MRQLPAPQIGQQLRIGGVPCRARMLLKEGEHPVGNAHTVPAGNDEGAIRLAPEPPLLRLEILLFAEDDAPLHVLQHPKQFFLREPHHRIAAGRHLNRQAGDAICKRLRTRRRDQRKHPSRVHKGTQRNNLFHAMIPCVPCISLFCDGLANVCTSQPHPPTGK